MFIIWNQNRLNLWFLTLVRLESVGNIEAAITCDTAADHHEIVFVVAELLGVRRPQRFDSTARVRYGALRLDDELDERHKYEGVVADCWLGADAGQQISILEAASAAVGDQQVLLHRAAQSNKSELKLK